MDIVDPGSHCSGGATGQGRAAPSGGPPQNDRLIRGSDHAGALEVGEVRYIKLGEKGKWARQALGQGILPFGYRAVDHRPCAEGDWQEVDRQLIAMGRTTGGASQGRRELKDFYELPEDTLWVTMADGHLWWAFADGPVVPLDNAGPESPSRFRRTRNAWCRTSLNGTPLTVRSLGSAPTSTANYRMTICAVRQADYLLRKIRGDIDPLRTAAERLQAETIQLAVKMIRRLDWRDFETLVDLIFTRSGWHRISALGRGQPDVDLVLKQPVTGETAWVQVKSGSTAADFYDYLDRFHRDGSCDRLFFICHSPAGALSAPADAKVISGRRSVSRAPQPRLASWIGWSTTRLNQGGAGRRLPGRSVSIPHTARGPAMQHRGCAPRQSPQTFLR